MVWDFRGFKSGAPVGRCALAWEWGDTKANSGRNLPLCGSGLRCIHAFSHYIPLTQWRPVSGAASEEFLMFVTPAYAQTSGIGGGGEILMSILPFVLIFVIMYFLIIRPQRTQMKKREEMLKSVRRGDQIITGGGILGKVTKVVDDYELEIEIGEGVKVRTLRSLIADVRVKTEPVKE